MYRFGWRTFLKWKGQWISLLFFACAMQFSIAATAEPYRRLVNFEWEAIPNARLYEIEIAPVKSATETKPYLFTTTSPAWNGKLNPGIYTMRLRSKDHRGVPGNWSKAEEFAVQIEVLKIKQPEVVGNTPLVISTKQEKDYTMTFAWEELGGVNEYIVRINSLDGKFKYEQKTTAITHKVLLPVATEYEFEVAPIAEAGVLTEDATRRKFTLLAAKLDRPAIDKPESGYVRFLKWSKPLRTETFNTTVSRKEKNGRWRVLKKVSSQVDSTLDFANDWPGGVYKLSVQAEAKLTQSSEASEMQFTVFSGNRSPAAEFNATVRKSIEKITGWYGIASYFISQMNYKGTNPEKNARTSYSALGGTGRLGAGYSIPENPWGFVGIADLSGYIIGKQNFTFASVELDLINFQPSGDRGEFRYKLGAFYKELPETIGSGLTGDYKMDKVKAAGPHAGIEYWYSLTPKLGFQVNSQVYLSMVGVSTPNGQGLSPTVSYQVGLLGSYKIRPKITGLIGYAYKSENTSYWAVPSDQNDPSNQSFANAGDKNETNITGSYLNMLLEWAF
jgi:hypothetical protein